MSRHLLVSFAILAIFCAMTLSSNLDGHDGKISRVEVVGIDSKDHGMNHGTGHGMDHGIGHGMDLGMDHGIGHGMDHGMDHGIGHGMDHGMDHGIGHGMDHGIGHGMDHGLGHQLDGHVDHLSLGHDQHIPLGHGMPLDHGIPLGHDQHEIQIVKIPEIHEHEQPILSHDSHHDHGNHHCPKNEMWSKCGAHCEPSCKNRNPHCSKMCTAGCVCRKGLVRDAHHHCVKKCH
ncbi:uncharacterized protein LOC117607275 [Osmia lignaria lignaria]|uniref:uncharacterized protein LOC117607275 n=1 Tax=Osmia lignaria lignaria TaxID=1437193 RepID=UPI001478F089|nr:histidine-rich glycoprotein-like [Osmia lignaria]